MKVVGVIPARYKSSRFPGKPLVPIAGIPMIIRVADKVQQVLGREHTYIATDNNEIADTCRKYGYQAVMTSENCKTGTDRVVEFARHVDADIYVNVQGDEPVINPRDILAIANVKKAHFHKVINGMCYMLPGESPANPNIPKVVTADDGGLIYMSRLPVPGIKDQGMEKPLYKKQVCIYAFNKTELALYGSYQTKPACEAYEDIEILRFLDAGVRVQMVETSGHSIAVDTPEDILLVEAFLQARQAEKTSSSA